MRAAENMRLVHRVPTLRKRFSEAQSQPRMVYRAAAANQRLALAERTLRGAAERAGFFCALRFDFCRPGALFVASERPRASCCARYARHPP
jgi:hypothetical protein